MAKVVTFLESRSVVKYVARLHSFDKRKDLHIVNGSQCCCLHCVIPNVEVVAMDLGKLLNQIKPI